MALKLRTEDIYQAALDDGCFQQLSTTLAEQMAARSGVIHWRLLDDELEQETSYSGYFSADEMKMFEENFAGDDLWSAAVTAPDAVNRAWSSQQLVPERTFASSRIYNEWIVPMGDDTFHCLGAAIRTESFVAEIGFHRGKSQSPFDQEHVKALDRELSNLRQMISIRQKLLAATRAEESMRGTYNVLGQAVITLGLDGRVLHHNVAAEALLQEGDAIRLRSGEVEAVVPGDRTQLAAAIKRARTADREQATSLLVGRKGGGYCCVSVLRSFALPAPQIVLLISCSRLSDPNLSSTVRSLYALSHAEADIAIALAEGIAIAEVAAQRRTSIETVRSQVKAIMAKLRCSRQAELVSLIRSIPLFNLEPGTNSSVQACHLG